jgi:hypothetical protein
MSSPDPKPPPSLPIDPDACYLPTQLAAYLQVSTATLKDWRYRGGGPAHLKLKNGRIRYEGHEILKWKTSRRRRTTSDTPALRVVREEGRQA